MNCLRVNIFPVDGSEGGSSDEGSNKKGWCEFDHCKKMFLLLTGGRMQWSTLELFGLLAKREETSWGIEIVPAEVYKGSVARKITWGRTSVPVSMDRQCYGIVVILRSLASFSSYICSICSKNVRHRWYSIITCNRRLSSLISWPRFSKALHWRPSLRPDTVVIDGVLVIARWKKDAQAVSCKENQRNAPHKSWLFVRSPPESQDMWVS